MLIGVQCEVVSNVAQHEKDDIEITLMKTTVLVMLKHLDADNSGEIDQEEMMSLLENEEALQVLGSLSIDVTFLVSYLMMLYEANEALSIKSIMDVMLQFRGGQPATVRDLVHFAQYNIWVLTGRNLGNGG
jgi:hypothetical protein